jgi:hypothetical protein|tara:strand:+ start:284 stop:484 length:201 start_codon:yes stop_codon:yes gene_type:complete
MVKPTQEEINKMTYKKPITSYKDVKLPDAAKGSPMYMDGSNVMPTPNVDFVDDKSNYAKGSKRNTL